MQVRTKPLIDQETLENHLREMIQLSCNEPNLIIKNRAALVLKDLLPHIEKWLLNVPEEKTQADHTKKLTSTLKSLISITEKNEKLKAFTTIAKLVLDIIENNRRMEIRECVTADEHHSFIETLRQYRLSLIPDSTTLFPGIHLKTGFASLTEKVEALNEVTISSLYKLGYTHYEKKEYKLAEACFHQAIDALSNTTDNANNTDIIKILNSNMLLCKALASIFQAYDYVSEEKYEESQHLFQEAIDVLKTLNYHKDIAYFKDEMLRWGGFGFEQRGRHHFNNKMIKEAKSQFQIALDKNNEIANKSEVDKKNIELIKENMLHCDCAILEEQASQHRNREEYQEEKQFYEESLRLRLNINKTEQDKENIETLKKNILRSDCHNLVKQAKQHNRPGEYKQGKDFLKQALSITNSIVNKSKTDEKNIEDLNANILRFDAYDFLHQSIQYFDKGEYKKAKDLTQQIIDEIFSKILNKSDDDKRFIQALKNNILRCDEALDKKTAIELYQVGHNHYNKKEYKQAGIHYQQSIDAFSRIPTQTTDDIEVIKALKNNLLLCKGHDLKLEAHKHFEKDEYQQAISLFKESIDTLNKTVNKAQYVKDSIENSEIFIQSCRGHTLIQQATKHNAKNEFKQAKTLYRETIEIFNKLVSKNQEFKKSIETLELNIRYCDINDLAHQANQLCKQYEFNPAKLLYKEALDSLELLNQTKDKKSISDLKEEIIRCNGNDLALQAVNHFADDEDEQTKLLSEKAIGILNNIINKTQEDKKHIKICKTILRHYKVIRLNKEKAEPAATNPVPNAKNTGTVATTFANSSPTLFGNSSTNADKTKAPPHASILVKK